MFQKKIIQSYIEPKLKSEDDFSDKRLRMRNSLSGIWFWEYSGKSVCINNHIKEIFTLLLTTDLRLSSI